MPEMAQYGPKMVPRWPRGGPKKDPRGHASVITVVCVVVVGVVVAVAVAVAVDVVVADVVVAVAVVVVAVVAVAVVVVVVAVAVVVVVVVAACVGDFRSAQLHNFPKLSSLPSKRIAILFSSTSFSLPCCKSC